MRDGKSGSFSLAGRHDNKVVVKVVNTADTFTQEMNALQRLSHPNVVRMLLDVKLDPQISSLTLMFEYAINGNLHSYLTRKKGDFDDQQLLEMAIDVANGMKQLERCNVVHCDLRAHNILVDSHMVCKVASLNKAHCLEHGEKYRICQNQQSAIRWQAPEVFKEKQFSVKSDVWAFGVLLFEIFSFGSTPYPNMSIDEVKRNIMGRIKMSKPDDCPEEVYQVMSYCFEFDATRRPSFGHLHQQLETIRTKKFSIQPEFA